MVEQEDDDNEVVEIDEESAKVDPLEGYKGNKIPSVLKAIRAKCLDCSSTSHEVKICNCFTCNLFPFRLGKNPYRAKRIMTDEQKNAARERFAKARAKKK